VDIRIALVSWALIEQHPNMETTLHSRSCRQLSLGSFGRNLPYTSLERRVTIDRARLAQLAQDEQLFHSWLSLLNNSIIRFVCVFPSLLRCAPLPGEFYSSATSSSSIRSSSYKLL
jgi:hypothetical protein